jgi:hypothetical protein
MCLTDNGWSSMNAAQAKRTATLRQGFFCYCGTTTHITRSGEVLQTPKALLLRQFIIFFQKGSICEFLPQLEGKLFLRTLLSLSYYIEHINVMHTKWHSNYISIWIRIKIFRKCFTWFLNTGDKWGCIKLKFFCRKKGAITRIKKKYTERKKNFSSYSLDKD